jgi:hypothetical protein
MKLHILLFSLFIFIYGGINAQSSIEGVVMDSLNNPVPYASVYLSKTTIGTFTDNAGHYSLTVPLNGAYEMIASCVGYRSNSLIIHSKDENQTINIKLDVNPVYLKEIIVTSKERSYSRNYLRFLKLFLGETFNSQRCNILNPGDLRLHLDQQDNVLKGYSVKPLKIINRALGYTIIYDLTDFNFNLKTGFLQIIGNPYFQPLKGTTGQNTRWRRNRLIAYYGSRMHLLRSLFSDSPDNENFKIFDFAVDNVAGKQPAIKEIPVNKLRLSYNKDSMNLFFDDTLRIIYTDSHPELNSGFLGFEKKAYYSSLIFSDTLLVYRNGYYVNPYSIIWEGDMGNERIADMLPFDFLPESVGVDQSSEAIDSSQIEKYLRYQQESTGADQVFVHLDRNMYRPGDTIRFQAYIRNRFSYEYGSKSVSLYALLFDEKQALADSSRFKIDNSTSSGWMAIPGNAKPGKYHFSAFTGMMQNFDPSDAFQLDLNVSDIKSSKIKNVASLKNKNKPSVPKDLNIPSENRNIELRFLPEGGTLVYGPEQRIGFNATNAKGEPVCIEGLLKNNTGIILDTIKSGTFGPGFFEFIPQRGMYVELINSVTEEKIWPLPDPVSNGICLSVKPAGDRSFAVEIQSDSYNGDSVIVTGIMNLNQIFSRELILNKKQRITVETDQLPAGVVQITLFDKHLRPVAERLFYVNADKHLKLKISPDKQLYDPGEETELSISITDDRGNPAEGIFSIAVIDSLTGHDAEIFTPDIDYSLNYHPYFPGNLPAKVLAAGLENLSSEDRDLLLMVYGWSKFNWDFKQPGTGKNENIDYDILNMRILYALKSHRVDRRLDLISLEGPSIKHLFTNKMGDIVFPLDSLPDIARSVSMMPDTKNKKRIQGAMLSIPHNEKYFKSSKLLIPQPSIPLNINYISQENYNISLGDSVIEIPEVTITGRQGSIKEYHDKYEEMYQYANIRSLDYEQLWSSNTLKDAIYRLISPYIMTDDYIVLRQPRSFFGGYGPALIVLDGMPLYTRDALSWVSSIPGRELTSLTILFGTQGFARYGEAAQGGVVFVNTRSDDPKLLKIRTQWILQNEKDKILLPINIYRQNKEFYCPAKSEIDADPVLQYRSTIFWDPEVYFTGKEPVKIKYTNLKRRGPVKITINGVSVNNLAGTGRSSYLVYPGGKK